MAKKNAEQAAAAAEQENVEVQLAEVAPTGKKPKHEIVEFIDHTSNEHNPHVIVWGIRFNTNDRKFINTLRHTPRHTLELSNILANNAEIRRFTALGIRNYLLQKGEVSKGAIFIKFRVNKFVVSNNGLNRDYNYDEPFFLNCLVASFTSFANFAQKTIEKFVRGQQIAIDWEEVIEQGTIDEIVASTEAHVAESITD